MRNFVGEFAQKIQPSGIRKFFDIVGEMPDAISLGVGEPDFVTPWGIRDSAIRSINKGYTQYTSNKGIPKLRDLISKYLKERFDLSYSREEILVTVGASEAIDLSLRATINSGDGILVPSPSYVSYSPIIELCGGKAIEVPCKEENGFKVTYDCLKKAVTKETKAIILPFPNNPTGAILEREYLEEVARFVLEYDLLVITDEIYAELTYGSEKHVSIASIDKMIERTIYINGFSKAFAMTGWRIGYLCCKNVDIMSAILKIHQYAIMCAPTFSQYGAMYALEEGLQDDFSIVKEMHDEYDKRRRYLVSAFNEMGLTCFEPKGAFYVFPNVFEKTGLTGEQFAERLLKEEKVAVVPGNAFGESGKYNVRCAYAYSMAKLTEAIKRIGRFVEKVSK